MSILYPITILRIMVIVLFVRLHLALYQDRYLDHIVVIFLLGFEKHHSNV